MLTCGLHLQKQFFKVIVLVSIALTFHIGSLQPFLPKKNNDKPQVTNIRGETMFEENTSFMQLMKTFPWAPFKNSVDSGDLQQMQSYSTLLVKRLFPYLIMPPTVPLNESCYAPPLQIPQTPPCQKLLRRRKVGMLLQFGFDINALEIHLHELTDVVDKFFLIEALKAHSMYTSTKPLVWEAIKNQERFAKFSDRVVHLIVDDASLSETDLKKNIWQRETQQERLRWEKFMQWNNATNYFVSEDLLGFGDVDEIPCRNNVFFLKNCQLPSDPIDIGIWFPLDGLGSVFASDFPVKGHPNTLGNPTFWTLGKALSVNQADKYPTRLRGGSTSFLLGGVHLSWNAYPPHLLIRRITATEVGVENLRYVIMLGKLYASNRTIDASKIVHETYKNERRIISIDTFKNRSKTEADAIVKMPWLLACNLRRYPSFGKDTDARLEAIKK